MKRLAWLLALMMLALLACKRVKWQEFTSAEGRFAVLLPGTPKPESETAKTEAGDIEQKIFMVEIADAAYGVMYCDYPRELVTPLTRAAMLDGAVEGAVGSVAGPPPAASGSAAAGANVAPAIPRKEISIDGHPGREFQSTTKEGYDYKARIYLVDNRLYQVVITARPGTSKPENELKFMNSFRLLK